MINKPQLSGRIARWVLLFQEVNFTIQVQLGKSHANVDHFSQINQEVGSESITNNFLDANLFQVDIILMEYDDIIHYFSMEQFLLECIEKQKKMLVYKTNSCTLIVGMLYKKG